MKKQWPKLTSDEDAERFVDEADLSEYDFSQMKPVRFEFQDKDARVTMRLPATMLTALKKRALEVGLPYQRYIRQMIERDLDQHRR